MLVDILASLFAGLGMFFIGVKLIGAHLKQMTGRRFRMLVMKGTAHPAAAALLGSLAGAITQSTNAVAFIMMNLATAGLIEARRAMPVVGWANVGTSALVMVATLDIHLFVLYLLGLVGMAYYFNIDKSTRYRHIAGALLGISVLFLGLEFIKNGAAPLKSMAEVRDFLALSGQSYVLLFLIGAVLTLLAQSSATVSVVAVAMTSVGLFTMDQTLMVIYGAGLGSAASLWLLTANLRGTPKQLALYQGLYKLVGVAAMLLLFALENGLDIPLIKALIQWLSNDISVQAAWVYLLFQLVSTLLLGIAGERATRLVERLSPPTQEETLARPQFIYEQALDDPDTALDLVRSEQQRQLGHLPDYLDEVREEGIHATPRPVLHGALISVNREIATFITELLDRNRDRDDLNRVIRAQARNSLLSDLLDSLNDYTDALRSLTPGSPLHERAARLSEALHLMLVTLAEAQASGESTDLDLLLGLTGDKAELMERLRAAPPAHESSGGHAMAARLAEQAVFFHATVLFERLVWLVRRYGLQLRPDLNATPESRP